MTGLTTYPIKGAAGIAVQEAEVTPLGLKHDREFVLVDAKGKFLSQRNVPKMCLLTVDLGEESMIVSYPGRTPLVIRHTPARQGPSIPVDIFGKLGHGIDCGKMVATWFSDCLGIPCRLLQYDFTKVRHRNGDGWDIPISFADGFPVLLIPEESLADLNEKMLARGVATEPVGMDRFRPNLVVRGCEKPFEEDTWALVGIEGVSFIGEKICERCTVPLVDQATGIPAKGDPLGEPLATLSTYRRLKAIPGKSGGPIFFGKNLKVLTSGVIRVGDEVWADDGA